MASTGTEVTIDSYPNIQAIRIMDYYYDNANNRYVFDLPTKTSLIVNSLADRLSFDNKEEDTR